MVILQLLVCRNRPAASPLHSISAQNANNLHSLSEFTIFVKNDVISSRQSDFVIGEYTFEVGGRKKGKKQIEDIPNSYVVKDDIEFAYRNTIPLWAFGLNY